MRKFMAISLCLCMMLLSLCSCALDLPGFGTPSDEEINASSVQPTDEVVTTQAETTVATTAPVTTVAATTAASTAATEATNSVLSGNNSSTKSSSKTTTKSTSKSNVKSTTKANNKNSNSVATTKKVSVVAPTTKIITVTVPNQTIIVEQPVTQPTVPVAVPTTEPTTAPTIPTATVEQPVVTTEPTTAPIPTEGTTAPIIPTDPPVGGTVIAYPENSLAVSTDIKMTAGGQNIQVNTIRANNNHKFNSHPNVSSTSLAMFDFAGSATVTLTYNVNITECTVRPLGKGVTPTISGNTVTFTITEVGQYSVEVNGSVEENTLLIFANDVNADPAPSGNVRIIPAGTTEKGELEIRATSDETSVYLAPGAVWSGTFYFNNVNGAKISGKGIIDGSRYKPYKDNDTGARLPISLWVTDDIEISGITITNPNAWCLQIQNSSNVKVDNIKIISADPNGDGISIQSANNVTVTNSFLRTWDDTLVVKNYDNQGKFSYDITFDNCVLWNDLAQCMEIGYETNKGKSPNPIMKNINFKNITVIHALDGPVISIHNADNAAISDISYSNIIVEDMKASYLIQFNNNISTSGWTSVKDQRGTISGVSVDGVYVLDGKLAANGKPIASQVDASQGAITNVSISNVYFFGQKMASLDDMNMQLDNATVSFS